MPYVRLMPSNRWKRNEGRSLRICCWCDDETGAEEPSIELSADDKIKLGKMVADFVRSKASAHRWTTDKNLETTHTHVAGGGAMND